MTVERTAICWLPEHRPRRTPTSEEYAASGSSSCRRWSSGARGSSSNNWLGKGGGACAGSAGGAAFLAFLRNLCLVPAGAICIERIRIDSFFLAPFRQHRTHVG